MLDVISDVIDHVPKYSVFMNVEELNESTFKLTEKYPDIVKVFNVGYSRDGNSIYLLKIGDGRNKALWFGCPHPNEPVGTLVLDYLSWKLAENSELRDELDFTWYIVKVIDVDGLKLNEGWLKGPFTPLNYAKNYYRPAGNKQVEWTFPIEYKTLKFNEPLPETRVLMNIIEMEKPDFIYSLHNAGFGGVYYYVTEKIPLLYPIYTKFPRDLGVPLSLGEPEVPWAKTLAPAIYLMLSTPEYYDYLEKYAGRDPAQIIKTGTSSFDYARRFNPQVFELVTEVPYYYDPRIEDLNPSKTHRRKAVLDEIEQSKSFYNLIKSSFDKVKDRLKVQSRFRESIEYYLEVFPKSIVAEENWAKSSPELDRMATIAEEFDNYLVSEFYRLLTLGLFCRMLKAEDGDSIISEVLSSMENELEIRAEKLERELNYTVINIDKLVKIQLAAGLYTSLYIKIKNTYKQ
ncbi:MAG: M14 family zinc carboxypeptidase [Candidatus Methanomethylicia archaeon]